jgi:hypothetical protein
MEPAANLPDPAGSTGLVGELVVQNGRQTGARRPLATPLTLIGQAPGCDVRLNVEGVSPLHCVIVQTPAGPLVRDLGAEPCTRVNGKLVRAQTLRHGDRVEVGPFQFALELADPAEVEYEPLRIQAAAVAAQQAALDEEEGRLEQRATTLEKQEAQLAGHLEERQRRLEEKEARFQEAREAFEAECRAAREALDEERAAVVQERTSASQERVAASRERARLLALRGRLRQRWRRHFAAREAALSRREAEVASEQQRLTRERERVTQFQLRVNGELELGRRQLRQDWQELGLAQQGWEVTLNREQAERQRQAGALAEAERCLAEAQQRWQQGQADRVREAQGLDARITNARARLAEVEQQLGRPPAFEPLPPAPPTPVALAPGAQTCEEPSETSGFLRLLAGQLGDQRHHLIEQWEKLLAVHERWHAERARAVADLEGQARALARREQAVEERDQRLQAGQGELQRRQEELSRLRQALEGWRARLAVEEASGRAERARVLAEIEAQERAVAVRARELEEDQRLHQERCQEEQEELQEVCDRWEELRRQYHVLWGALQKRQEVLVRQERESAARTLALERYHEELLARSPSAARAESRIQRLRQREAGRLEEIGRALEVQLQKLHEEATRVSEQAAGLEQRETDLGQRQAGVQRQEEAWQERRAAAAQEQEQARRELHQLRARQALDGRLLAALREEVERMARLLIEEGEPAGVAQQAARNSLRPASPPPRRRGQRRAVPPPPAALRRSAPTRSGRRS